MRVFILYISTLLSFISGQNYYKDPNWVYEATAKFHRYAMGSVTIINGHVMIDLDITNVSSYEGEEIPEDCFKDGAYLHIHDDWNNDLETDYMTEDNCDEDQTGDHFDPWFACSTSSGEQACRNNDGCITPSSFIEDLGAGADYTCNTDDYSYSDYPYACELGDMNKHDMTIDISGNKIDETFSSLWEINGLDFGNDFSVVLHCSDRVKTPVLCAPFNVTNRTKKSSDPSHIQNKDNRMSVNFDGLNVYGRSYNDIEIIQGEGWIRYKLPSRISENCTIWSAYIMDKWNHTMDKSSAKYDEMCDEKYVGGVYDPTYSCINNEDAGFLDSGNPDCDGETRCPDDNPEDVNYVCDNYENALKCAAGHMTGRTGYINMTNGKNYDMTFDDRVSPPLDDLVGRSVLLYCESPANSNPMPMKICTQISNSAVSFSSEEDVGVTAGGAIAIVILILLIIGIGSAYIYGKKHPKNNQSGNDPKERFTKLNSIPTTEVNTPVPNATGSVNNNNNGNHMNQMTPPPAPVETQVNNDTGGIAYAPPPKEKKESLALPADTATDTPMGTMNEGGGYIDNDDEDVALPPPVNDNNDDEYEYYDEEVVDDNQEQQNLNV